LWYFFDEKQPQLVYALPEATKRLCYRSRNQNIGVLFNELGYQYLLASCDKPNLESESSRKNWMREVEEKKAVTLFIILQGWEIVGKVLSNNSVATDCW